MGKIAAAALARVRARAGKPHGDSFCARLPYAEKLSVIRLP